nr:RNA polymerase II degradation factor 1-like [Aegilops tauschii subsp. strangulata]
MRNNKIDCHSKMKMDVSQLCDRRNDEIKRQADLAQHREREEKRQRAQAREIKPREVMDRRVQSTTADAPFDTSAPLQQIPPSPHPKEAAEQQAEPVVVVPTSVEQEADVVDMYIVNPNKVNAMPEQNAPEENTDEEIEMEKQVPSPEKDIQAEPSRSTKEGEMIEGSKLMPKPEHEEKKPREPMAPEEKVQEDAPPVPQHQTIPPVLPQQAIGELAETLESQEVFVLPPVDVSPKEKALVPESEKAVEGVPAKENDSPSSDPMPSASEKDMIPHALVHPSDENAPADDDIQPMEISKEVYQKNPQESFPLFI